MQLPADIVNRAYDALGTGIIIGSFDDGTTESEAARRIYGPQLRQLLRAANWAFARKRAPIQLLADATGVTPSVGTNVEPPWLYAYAWPIDGVRARWLPWSGFPPQGLTTGGLPPIPGNVGIGTTPIMPNLNAGGGATPLYPLERPARFLCAVTDQYPAVIGATDWANLPDLDYIEGVGPNSRRIILTNVPPFGSGVMSGAQLVYTFLCLEIEVWDDLFSEAMVAALASRLALPSIAGKTGATPQDKARAIAERNNQIAIAKNAVREARVASSQEAGWPQTTDHTPDWIRTRRTGRARWGAWGEFGDGAGPGYTYYGWEGIGWADGSVY